MKEGVNMANKEIHVDNEDNYIDFSAQSAYASVIKANECYMIIIRVKGEQVNIKQLKGELNAERINILSEDEATDKFPEYNNTAKMIVQNTYDLPVYISRKVFNTLDLYIKTGQNSDCKNMSIHTLAEIISESNGNIIF